MNWLLRWLIVLTPLLVWSQAFSGQEPPISPNPPMTAGQQKVHGPSQFVSVLAVPQGVAPQIGSAEKDPTIVEAGGPGGVGVALIAQAMNWEELARERVQSVLSAIPRIPQEYLRALAILDSDASRDGLAPFSVLAIVLIVIGMLAERLLWRRCRRHWGGAWHVLPAIALVALIGPLYLALALPPLVRLTLGCYLVAFLAYRLTSAAIEHSTQPRYHPRLKATLAILLMGWTAAAVGAILGIEDAVVNAIVLLTSFILLLLTIELVWSSDEAKAAKKTAVSLLIFGVWLLWCLGLDVFFWLGVYLITLPHILKTVSSRLHENTRAEASTTRRILLVRGTRSLIVVAALIWVLHVWHANAGSIGRDDPQVRAAVFGLVKAAFVLLLAELLWHLGKAAIDRLLVTPSSRSPSGVPSLDLDEHATRLNTLLPVVRNLLAVALLTIAGLTILGQLGFDTAPLLAGAGIFGVAIGFGSQTLVRDVISGIFYLFDDAFRVGEYIQAKDYKGTVEGFSLRSVKLRHHRGPLFTVPFGDLGAVENMSRDWSKMKLVITLPYNTDLETVRKIGKSIGQSLSNDAEFGRYFVEPLKMKGVEEFGQYGIVVSFSMVILPTSQQGFIRRSAFAMLRKAFQENGISFAQPTVQFGGKDLAEAPSSLPPSQ
jgi:small-conductance mechanosensitive channel